MIEILPWGGIPCGGRPGMPWEGIGIDCRGTNELSSNGFEQATVSLDEFEYGLEESGGGGANGVSLLLSLLFFSLALSLPFSGLGMMIFGKHWTT